MQPADQGPYPSPKVLCVSSELYGAKKPFFRTETALLWKKEDAFQMN